MPRRPVNFAFAKVGLAKPALQPMHSANTAAAQGLEFVAPGSGNVLGNLFFGCAGSAH